MQVLRLREEVQRSLRVQGREEGQLNSLDPRLKRLRAADRSLQQARNALTGAVLALDDLPRSGLSPVTAALESIAAALESLDSAAALLDEARLNDDEGALE